MKRVLTVLVAVSLVLAVLPWRAALAAEPVEITIVHDTHTHGNFKAAKSNIAQKAHIINGIRASKASVLFVGSGDDLATSLLSREFKGSHMVDALNQMGLLVNTIGNHEFDYGPDNFLARVRESRFTWVTANVRDRRTGDAFGSGAGVRKYAIVDVGGVKVGFTGLAPVDTPQLSSTGPDVVVLDYATALADVLPAMRREGAQIVVLLSHICGPEAEALASTVAGIDVILGDHCADVLEQPKLIGNTIVSRVGDEFRYVGELTLVVRDGKVATWRFARHEIKEDTPADPAVAALVRNYEAKLEAGLQQVVGYTHTPLDALKADNRFRETALGNYVSDVARAVMGTDVAITNGGSIRADKVFQPGPLTKRDIVEILPFPNTLVKLEVTGATLLAALEHGVSSIEQGHGRFPQVSGIRFRLDPTRPAGQRVSDVWVGSAPLDPAARYTLAVNSFLARGGDGYDMLKTARVLVDAHAGPLVTDAVMQAIQRAGTIAPRTQGRILFAAGVSLEAGRPELRIAGHAQAIDVAPELRDGALYVPVRWVAELYGARIQWHARSQTAIVRMPWGKARRLRVGIDGYLVRDRLVVPPQVLSDLGLKVQVQGASLSLGLE